jgi:hypothetical protein
MDASVTFCERSAQLIEGFWSQNVSIAVLIAVIYCKLRRLARLRSLYLQTSEQFGMSPAMKLAAVPNEDDGARTECYSVWCREQALSQT